MDSIPYASTVGRGSCRECFRRRRASNLRHFLLQLNLVTDDRHVEQGACFETQFLAEFDGYQNAPCFVEYRSHPRDFVVRCPIFQPIFRPMRLLLSALRPLLSPPETVCQSRTKQDHPASKMSFQQLSAKLRQIRSEMPRVTSERAYAQMDRLMGRTTSSDPKKSGQPSVSGPKRTD